MSKYKVILIDCPLSYNDKASAGERGAEFKYPTMTDEALLKLPISQIADDDCALLLWATMPRLEFAFDLIKAWGFKYKTVCFQWLKMNKKATNTLFTGMGNWSRANGELVLLATRGKPKRASASVHSVVMTPIEAHSKKPKEIHRRIEQLFGDVSRVELFAREETAGWTSLGNGLEGAKDIFDSLNELINKKD